jgi:hypothetical protein
MEESVPQCAQHQQFPRESNGVDFLVIGFFRGKEAFSQLTSLWYMVGMTNFPDCYITSGSRQQPRPADRIRVVQGADCRGLCGTRRTLIDLAIRTAEISSGAGVMLPEAV